MMKKAVMYGGGNIGRGFISQLFYLSGYETVFIDVNEELVNNINSAHEYPVYVTDANTDDYNIFTVKNVRAVNGRDSAAVAVEIANADIMATAVGVNILKFIAKPIAEGVKLRCKGNLKPLNIIICENKIDADKYLRQLVSNELEENENIYFDANIGLVEASIGRMVPAVPERIKAENPLAVCVEPYCELPVDKKAFKGEIPQIVNMIPDSPFEFYIQRKLYLHNMSHAFLAYMGYLKGYTYIWEAAGDIKLRYAVLNAMLESSLTLSKKHNMDIEPLIEYSNDLLERFDNKLLGDTILRVGKDTKRKLGADDRIVGIINLCLERGKVPHYILEALALGLLFNPADGDESSIEVYNYCKENGVKAALDKYSGITDSAVCETVENYYNKFSLEK